MVASRLADIREQLLAEQERITQGLEVARGKVRELEAELEHVEQMLAVGEKQTRKGNGRPKKRMASCDEVSQAIVSVLCQKGAVAEEELKELVKKRVVQSGHSRTGLALRFREALKDDRFVDSPGGYRLQSEESAGGEPKERLPETVS